MIKSYGPSYTNLYSLPYWSPDDRGDYYDFYNSSDIGLKWKIKMQLSKYNVWKVEINSIKSLRESNRINEMERLLLEDHQNILQREAWECFMRLCILYKENSPEDFLKLEIPKEIGIDEINLKKPVIKRNIDCTKYHTYSYLDKVRLRIAQRRMLNMEQYALGRRYKSLNKYIFEDTYLKYRSSILRECIDLDYKYIMHIFYKEIPRDSPELKESYEEIVKAHLNFRYKSGWEHINDLEYYRYPYDFERPDDVSPIDWVSPINDWKTGY